MPDRARAAPKPIEILPVEQPGTLVGVVQGVGGKVVNDARVAVYIDTGDTVHACTAPRAIAKGLGQFMLGDERRFEGSATWQRDQDGAWSLKRFVITHHEPIEGRTLSEVVERLRAVPSGLTELRDPWGEIMRDRNEEGEPHMLPVSDETAAKAAAAGKAVTDEPREDLPIRSRLISERDLVWTTPEEWTGTL